MNSGGRGGAGLIEFRGEGGGGNVCGMSPPLFLNGTALMLAIVDDDDDYNKWIEEDDNNDEYI